MKKNTDINSSTEDEPSRYVKFSDNFFTYYLKDPYITNKFNRRFKFITIMTNVVFIVLGIFIIIYFIEDIALIIVGSLLIVIPNILLYIIYKCIKTIKENIFRIDIIYTSDFDRIFIGLVKYTETSYVNTFEFQINNINKFILESLGNNNCNLKVIFTNNDSQLICNIKKNQQELEGLVYILNERLINNNNDINEINIIGNDNNQI